MSELIFYTNPMSRGQIVRWMLEETGLNYETSILDYGTTMKSAEYLAINPMGKVPAIKHGDRVITETAAILTYLAELCPDKALCPPLEDRADYYRWLFFVAGPVEAATTARTLGLEAGPDHSGMAGYGSFDTVISVLEDLVSHKTYIAADHFTAADLYLGAQIDFGLNFKSLPDLPAFQAYRDKVTDRDAYRRAKDIDNKLIAAMQV